MNKLIISMLLILTVSCTSKKQESIKSPIAKLKVHGPIHLDEHASMYSTFTDNDYELQFELSPLGINSYNLIIDMQLKNGSYYVSPKSTKGNFKGIFSILIEENDKIEIIDKLIETPPSVEKFDPHPHVNGYVNWVKENTVYTQKITLKSDESFTINGVIQFTIEPRCTLEKVPFFIKYHNGQIKVEIDRC